MRGPIVAISTNLPTDLSQSVAGPLVDMQYRETTTGTTAYMASCTTSAGWTTLGIDLISVVDR